MALARRTRARLVQPAAIDISITPTSEGLWTVNGADDEAYTYNKRINRLATVQEHFMIVRAIERGVSEDKLANALNLDVKAINRRRTLLVGICPEVIELLKDKSVNPKHLRGAAQDEANAPARRGRADEHGR